MEELFEQIIYQAIKKNVSDIHLQCTEDVYKRQVEE